MRAVYVFAVLLASASAASISQNKVSCTDQDDIKALLQNIAQPKCHKQCATSTYDPEKNTDDYKDPEDMRKFVELHRNYTIPQGVVFSVFNADQLRQAVALFGLFHSAKDVDVLFKAACWARNNVNEGLYRYSFSVAIYHREDTSHCELPHIYEIYPYYFYHAETIRKAQYLKQLYHGSQGDTKAHRVVRSSYSGHSLSLHDEQIVSYFTEDIGINAYYYQYSIRYPFWMGSRYISKNDRRGELFYHVHQQLLARYYLERLSNDIGVIPMLDWTEPIEPGFRPSMQYHNGLEFPDRPNHQRLKSHADYNHPYYSNYSRAYTYVLDYARRMRDAVDLGYIYGHQGEKINIYEEQGFETLAYAVEGNPDSPNNNYYGDVQMYTRHLLGYTKFPYDRHRTVPSALEHFETSLRDPVFHQYAKKMISYFQEYKMHLPPYTKKELLAASIKITELELLSQLVTRFETVTSDLSNAVFYDEHHCPDEHFHVTAEQRRLKHDGYTFKIAVESKKSMAAVVRVFIGPKYDEHGRTIDINENRMNFFEIDNFKYSLRAGTNEIVRTDTEAQHPAGHRGWGFPRSHFLPKGKEKGQTFQVYIIINPESDYHGAQTTADYRDHRPMGFPFDRYIDKAVFFVPNSIFKDVVIYHKEDDEKNRTT